MFDIVVVYLFIILVVVVLLFVFFFFFKQKTAYEMRISDWSSDVCSSDLAWSPPREEGRLRVLWSGLKASAFRWVPRDVTILDVGCGFGEEIGRASCRERVCQYV